MREIAIIVPAGYTFSLLKGIRLYDIQYLKIITFLAGIVIT